MEAERSEPYHSWNGSQGIFRERQQMQHEDALSKRVRERSREVADEARKEQLREQHRVDGAEYNGKAAAIQQKQAQHDLLRRKEMVRLEGARALSSHRAFKSTWPQAPCAQCRVHLRDGGRGKRGVPHR